MLLLPWGFADVFIRVGSVDKQIRRRHMLADRMRCRRSLVSRGTLVYVWR